MAAKSKLCQALCFNHASKAEGAAALTSSQRLPTLLSVSSVNKRSLAKFRERLVGLIHHF